MDDSNMGFQDGQLFEDGQFVGDITNVRLTKEPVPMTSMPDGSPIVSVDSKGNVVGDTSKIDPNILAQLADPATKAKIQQMYRDGRYGKKEEPKPPRYLNEGVRRDFSKMKPANMTNKQFKTLRKKAFRELTKKTLKMQRSSYHG